jgi:hypothetical protein
MGTMNRQQLSADAWATMVKTLGAGGVLWRRSCHKERACRVSLNGGERSHIPSAGKMPLKSASSQASRPSIGCIRQGLVCSCCIGLMEQDAPSMAPPAAITMLVQAAHQLVTLYFVSGIGTEAVAGVSAGETQGSSSVPLHRF